MQLSRKIRENSRARKGKVTMLCIVVLETAYAAIIAISNVSVVAVSAVGAAPTDCGRDYTD